MTGAPTVRSVSERDFSAWLPLWEGYNSFYKRTIASEVTEVTWSRFFQSEEPLFALVAEIDGQVVGFVHFLFHRSTSSVEPVCYLQDLFVQDGVRGKGVGRRLIEAVYQRAREDGSSRVYWQTHESNITARSLYDQIADYSGFLIYRKILK